MDILYFKLLSLVAIISMTFADLYEFEFLESKIFKPCPKYPDHFLDRLVDLSNLDVGQTDDGTLTMNGFMLFKKSYNQIMPFSLEMLKRERGSYQPTTINVKRADCCESVFDKNDVIYNYLKETPVDQTKCPFKKGQKLTMKVSDPVHINFPSRNAAGEYLIHMEIGNKTDMSTFLCSEIPANLHKV